jgi:hypothetical protein
MQAADGSHLGAGRPDGCLPRWHETAPECLGEVVGELRQRRGRACEDRRREDQQRRELERWHRLFAMGEIHEATLLREIELLKQVLATVEKRAEGVDVEEALGYLYSCSTDVSGSETTG